MSRFGLAAALAVVIALGRAPVAVAQTSDASSSESSSTWGPRGVAGAIVDSLKLVMLEHATRISFQDKTRAELLGPFWHDYLRSVRRPTHWNDTDSWAVNYLGHPVHGAAAGIIWLDHKERDRAPSWFGPGYLASRARAATFAAFYSLQFEIGPLSEASLGNVGLDPATVGWVDYVVTPVGGFAFMILEDVLDRYLVRWVESRVQNRLVRVAFRLGCGPARFLANVAESRLPWYRPGRPLSWTR
jgi:hypothetical protein